jgi:beta-lactamase class A
VKKQLLITALVVAAFPAPALASTWAERIVSAREYAESRAGVESFALVDEQGRLHGYRMWKTVPSASVLKATLLVAYLRQPSVKVRALRRADRRLLAPMIRWSDNATASSLVVRLGEWRIERFAHTVGMERFQLRHPWGLSEITAAEQARYFFRIDRLAPLRHRSYVRLLLSSIIPAQRWGIPPARPAGWRIFFKGGWGSGTGWVTHQVALLENGDRRLSLAILTRFNPSHAYGTQTIRGIAARLLREPFPA